MLGEAFFRIDAFCDIAVLALACDHRLWNYIVPDKARHLLT